MIRIITLPIQSIFDAIRHQRNQRLMMSYILKINPKQNYCALRTEEIAITWHIEDVQGVRSDLTDQQASDVLIHLKKNHDATVGINWDTLEIVADILFPFDAIHPEYKEVSA